jgi:hypothetical protein
MITDTKVIEIPVTIKGHRNARGVLCAMVEWRDAVLASGAGWRQRGRYKGHDLYTPPEGTPMPAIGETFMGRAWVPADERVAAILRQFMEREPGKRLSELVSPGGGSEVTFRGVSFRPAPEGGGAYHVAVEGRYRRFISDEEAEELAND